MKQIYTNVLSVNTRKGAPALPLTNQAKGKKIIVDIIGPKKGKK